MVLLVSFLFFFLYGNVEATLLSKVCAKIHFKKRPILAEIYTYRSEDPGMEMLKQPWNKTTLELQGQPFTNGSFNWMIRNLYMENG